MYKLSNEKCLRQKIIFMNIRSENTNNFKMSCYKKIKNGVFQKLGTYYLLSL